MGLTIDTNILLIPYSLYIHGILNLVLAVAFQTLSERDHYLMLDFLGTAINSEAQILTEGGWI